MFAYCSYNFELFKISGASIQTTDKHNYFKKILIFVYIDKTRDY